VGAAGAKRRLGSAPEEATMNKVVHFEIPFDNKARAMKFYSETFGWEWRPTT
jgi:predicted enzyme related to lactoylglutathione lyase